MMRPEYGTDCKFESPCIGIVTVQFEASAFEPLNADAVHRPDALRDVIEVVKQGDDVLLVRDRHAESDEVGILHDDLFQIIDVLRLEVLEDAIGESLPLEFLGEELLGERVAEGETENAEFSH